MPNLQVKCHPTLGILVRDDGCIYLSNSGPNKAHWTFGTKHISGYLRVRVAGKHYRVHRLVAETFIGPIPEGYEIDHINRVKDDNRIENIRIVTRSENNRNTFAHDRVTERGGTHRYEDGQQYYREYVSRNKDKVLEYQAHYRARNKDKVLEHGACYRKSKRNTHRQVRFSDGSRHWIPNEEALELLKFPKSQRFIKEPYI